MALLHSLPQELIHQVAQDLDDQDDLLSLRLTCKDLNYKFHELHLDSIFRCRRIFIVPRSLHNLLKILQHPSGVGSRLRHLKFADLNPYGDIEVDIFPFLMLDHDDGNVLDTPIGLCTGYWGLDLWDFGQPRTSTKPNPSREVSHKSQRQRLLKAKRPLCKEAEVAIATDKDLELLFEIFITLEEMGLLKNIEIEIEKNSTLRARWEMNLLYPSLGLTPGSRTQNFISLTQRAGVQYRSPQINVSQRVMLALLESPVKSIGKISSRYTAAGDAFSHDWFQGMYHISSRAEASRKTFPNVRSLDICVHAAGSTNNVGLSLPKHERLVCQWLESLGGTLEELKFKYPRPIVRFPRMTIIPVTTGLPRLKTLHFSHITINLTELLVLLGTCRDTLREFKIIECKAVELKRGAFELLRYLRRHTKRLRIFECDFKDDEIRREGYYPITISVNGLWNLDTTECVVKTKVDQWVVRFAGGPETLQLHDRVHRKTYEIYRTSKRIKRELDDERNYTASDFWRSLLDGVWDFWDDVNPEAYYHVDAGDLYGQVSSYVDSWMEEFGVGEFGL
ncbi:hypothetical protein TWF481_011047 [Arthrobotrys musiformis]|uniref:F-box domain-containing protein n=1 Tax=Arthrobotrys musiformis TaxID=47236 RepID=A0AAV9VZM7_9PEZI